MSKIICDAPSPTQEHPPLATSLTRFSGWRLDEKVWPIHQALVALDEHNEDRVWRTAGAAADAIKALIADRNEWRRVAQGQTPQGSEFATPRECQEYISARREDAHNTKIEVVLLRRQLAALKAEASVDPSPPPTSAEPSK